jgi:hypothetical protein
MKTIILGYADAEGYSAPKIICDPSVPPADQIRIFQRAKTEHQFPAGIVRMEHCVLAEYPDIAIHLGQEISEAIASRRLIDEKAESEKAEKLASQRAERQAIVDAESRVLEASVKRNKLLSLKNEAEMKLRQARAADAALPSELHKAAVAAALKIIEGDPAEKIASLDKRIKKAIADYDSAVKELKQLTSHKKAA